MCIKEANIIYSIVDVASYVHLLVCFSYILYKTDKVAEGNELVACKFNPKPGVRARLDMSKFHVTRYVLIKTPIIL